MNNPYIIGKTRPGIDHLTGNFLYIAGSDLYNRLNQPSQHMPYHLANHLELLDLVGYKRFYDGPPAPSWKRLGHGIRNVLFNRIVVSENRNIRTIAARRIRIPEFLDVLMQDLWMWILLKPLMKRQYEVGIVDGPESATFASLLKRNGRVRSLVYYDIDYYPGQSPQWAAILEKREKALSKIADAVASVSRPLSELRKAQGAKLAVTIPNGVDFNRFNVANQIRNGHSPTLLYSGSLDVRWGVDLPIRAMPLLRQQFPDIRLLIAGRGPAETDLVQLAQSLGVADRVHFQGFVPYQDLPNLMAQADIGTATSRRDAFRQYASPLKIVEYMAAGLPVICSGGGEAELMIRESYAGVNIPFEIGAFTEAVKLLLTSHDKFLATRQSAIKYAQKRSWEEMGKMMAQLVAQLLGILDFEPQTINNTGNIN